MWDKLKCSGKGATQHSSNGLLSNALESSTGLVYEHALVDDTAERCSPTAWAMMSSKMLYSVKVCVRCKVPSCLLLPSTIKSRLTEALAIVHTQAMRRRCTCMWT